MKRMFIKVTSLKLSAKKNVLEAENFREPENFRKVKKCYNCEPENERDREKTCETENIPQPENVRELENVHEPEIVRDSEKCLHAGK